MEKREFILEFSHKAQLFPIEVGESQIEQFYTYMGLLLQWNEKMNLTAITQPKEVILKHFMDSLTILPYLNGAEQILDIGTGAGFPGIPLKIVEKEKKFTLLDSLNKRVIFLNEVIQKLGLEKIQAIHGRAEEVAQKPENMEKYDVVVSRAVAKLNSLVEYMLPFLIIGGKCICMKSSDIEEEIKEAKNAIHILGGEIEKVDEIVLPESDIKRKIIVIKKINPTPKKFPRKPGMATKEPIT